MVGEMGADRVPDTLRYFRDNLSIGRLGLKEESWPSRHQAPWRAPAPPAPWRTTRRHLEHNSGRPISWVGTAVVIVGFIIGGIAMVPAPHWLFFWIGAAVAIVGCLILLFSKAMTTDWY